MIHADVVNPPDTTEKAAALALLALMYGISEDLWCAQWLSGLERILWSAAVKRQPTDAGMGYLTVRQVILLRLLSQECDGWWTWDDLAGAPVFVDRATWVRSLA